MRILDLFERRLQKTSYAFHGTSDVFLDSIMKHGLDPNPPQKRYDGTASADLENQSSLESFPGIYFSRKLPLAWNSASETRQKFGGNTIAVGIQFTEASVGTDEDDIYQWIDDIISPHGAIPVGFTGDELIGKIYDGDVEVIEEIADEYIHKFITSDEAPVQEPLKTIFKIIAGNIMNPDQAYWKSWLKDIRRSQDWQPFREAMFQLIEITREVQLRPERGTFRINRPIGFRGKTRIVVILKYDHKTTFPTVIWGEMPDLPNPVRLS